MNTSQIGNIGEAKTLCKFTELGVPVFLPYGDGNEIDMIAIFNGNLNKIQIKTTEKVHDDSLITWKLTKQGSYHGDRVKYEKDHIDYFSLYCIEADVLCLVPFELTDVNTISMRLNSYDGIKRSTMRFIDDYSFEKMIN